MRDYTFFVYMLCSSSRRALYTGVTNSAMIRKLQHLRSDESTFAGRYKTYRLVYYEIYSDVRKAIQREKEIKGWTRAKKNALVNSINPQWRDLSEDWGKPIPPLRRKNEI